MATKFKTLFKRKSSASSSSKKDSTGGETISSGTQLSLGSSIYGVTRQLVTSAGNQRHTANESRLQKSARVFVSSPFGGMEAERTELVNRYFPLLKAYCDKHGIVFCPIDLRWGITDKAVEDGQIINICLQEIDRCDVFVGMYGQRYGWHTTERDLTLTSSFTKASENYPWVEEFSDRSVTEVEFRHAHLNNPGPLPSFFYFRDKAYDEKMATDEAVVSKGDSFKYKTESDKAATYLENLKRAVKESSPIGFYDNYATPEEGAKLIYTELRSYFERMFAKSEKTESQAPEIFDHIRYLKRHALPVESLIGGDKIFLKIDEYVDRIVDEAPLLLVGDSGAGKSTVMSSWISNRMVKKPNDLVLFHFVGASSQSTSHRDILFRFVSYLRNELNPQGPKPASKVAELVRQFRSLLYLAHDKGITVVIMINDLNQISTSTSLGWLPRAFPPRTRVIFTIDNNASQNAILEALENLKCSKLQLEPFNNATKEDFIKHVLKVRGKELSTVQVESIAFHKPCANPLFLRVLIEELCVHGDFFTLDKKINNYLQANDVTQLFEKILERLEEEYNDYVDKSKVPNLVRAITTSIYVSVQGLSDLELLALLGIDGTSLSTITCVMDRYLINRFGVFTFSNYQFREAVRRRYLPSEAEIPKARDVVIQFFTYQLKEKVNPPRVAQELPQLLWREKRFDDLVEMITNPLIYLYLIENLPYDLLNFWRDSKASNDVIKDKYGGLLNALSGDELQKTLFKITGFLTLASQLTVVDSLLESARNLQESIEPKSPIMVEILNAMATNFVDYGDYDTAITLHNKNLTLEKDLLAEVKDETEKAKYELQYANTLSNIGVAQFKKREFAEAEKFQKEALELFKRLNGEYDMTVADSMNNLAVIYFAQKMWKEAEKYLLESLSIYDEIFLGEPSSFIGGTLLNLAIVYRNLKEIEKSEPLYSKAIEHRERTVGKLHPDYAQTLNGMAVFLMNTKNRPDRALPLFLESLQIYQKVYSPNHVDLAFAHENIAICILNMLEKSISDPEATIDKCETHQKEALRIFKENKANQQSFPNIYQRISEFYRLSGNFEKALEWSELLLDTFRNTSLLEEGDTKENKRNKALIMLYQGKPDDAIAILKEEKFPPNIYSSFYQSASTFYKSEDQLKIGMEGLQIGLQHYPGDDIFLYNLGHCSALLKQWTDSKTYFQQLVVINPNDVDALIGLGEAKKHLGEKDTSDLDKALKKLTSSDHRYDRINALKKEK